MLPADHCSALCAAPTFVLAVLVMDKDMDTALKDPIRRNKRYDDRPHHDDLDLAINAQDPPQHLDPIQVREHQVEQHDPRLEPRELRQPLLSAFGYANVKPEALQIGLDISCQPLLVVDDQDGRHVISKVGRPI